MHFARVMEKNTVWWRREQKPLTFIFLLQTLFSFSKDRLNGKEMKLFPTTTSFRQVQKKRIKKTRSYRQNREEKKPSTTHQIYATPLFAMLRQKKKPASPNWKKPTIPAPPSTKTPSWEAKKMLHEWSIPPNPQVKRLENWEPTADEKEEASAQIITQIFTEPSWRI